MVLSRLVFCSSCMVLCTCKGANRYNACPIANRVAMCGPGEKARPTRVFGKGKESPPYFLKETRKTLKTVCFKKTI